MVQDFNFTVNGGAVGGTTGTTVATLSATAQPGGTGSYVVQMAPTVGATFPNAVTLKLTGLPAGATYTITPSAIAAGSGTTTVTVTVTTAKQQTVTASTSARGGNGLPMTIAFTTLAPLLGTSKLRRALQAQMKASVLVLLVLSLLTMMGMTACGGGSGFLTQPPQTYPMTLTGTSGALHHSVTLNLTIQ
jgi:hypothetical protein